jgi:Spy/CpxP family protein refolding chaperone
MRTRVLILLAVVISCLGAEAQKPPADPPGTERKVVIRRHEMGKWWQDSETAKKLQLSDNQIAQLDQTFLDHRLKLIDDGAEMAKQDLKLQALLDADVPNEGQVNAQVDQVLAARGKLERESTMMNLDLRKVLTVEQWRQLKAIHGDRGMGGDKFFYRFQTGGPGAPPLPPLPPPGPDEQF